MFVIPGQPGKDVCDREVGVSRRDLLRVGGAGMLGLSLGSLFQLQAKEATVIRQGKEVKVRQRNYRNDDWQDRFSGRCFPR